MRKLSATIYGGCLATFWIVFFASIIAIVMIETENYSNCDKEICLITQTLDNCQIYFEETNTTCPCYGEPDEPVAFGTHGVDCYFDDEYSCPRLDQEYCYPAVFKVLIRIFYTVAIIFGVTSILGTLLLFPLIFIYQNSYYKFVEDHSNLANTS